MRHSRRDTLAVAAASAGLILAVIGVPAYAETTSPSPSSTSTPTSEPTDDPTDDPTEDPDDEPTDEPTDDPTEDPEDDEDDEDDPPSDQPTAPPTDEPAPEPDERERRDPDEAYDEGLQDAQTVAVAEAQRLLQQVLAAIDGAESNLSEARLAAEEARAADEEAQKELKIAVEIVERTQRRIDDIEGRTDGARAALGTVVREAYQNNGLSTVGVLLGAESPEDLSDRYVGMRTLLRASDTALGRLAADEADLRNALVTLEDQRAQQERLADDATDKREQTEAAEAAAEEAQQELASRHEEYAHALDLAEEARLEDYERYMELLEESSAIGDYLDGLDDEDYGPGVGSGDFVRPATGQVTSNYGPRMHPILGYVKQHTGIDFGRGDGNIYAADAGTVVEAKFNTAYGNMVILDHGVIDGQRVTTLYAHQTGLSVSVGQRVEKGQVIGKIGSTGYSTGPHLHFEVRLNGQHTDPVPWLP